MKTLLPLLAATLLALAGCGQKAADDTHLSVAATAVPHAEILNVVKPMLASEGITLDVKVFADYVQPNQQVAQKQIDVNYFQTEPYLDQFNRERGTHLVTVVGVHIEPFGAYSRKYKSIAELPDGASGLDAVTGGSDGGNLSGSQAWNDERPRTNSGIFGSNM